MRVFSFLALFVHWFLSLPLLDTCTDGLSFVTFWLGWAKLLGGLGAHDSAIFVFAEPPPLAHAVCHVPDSALPFVPVRLVNDSIDKLAGSQNEA